MLELLAFLESPLGKIAAALVVAALAAVVAFGEGYQLRGKLDTSAVAEARAEALQRSLDAANAAAAQEAAQAKIDTDALEERLKEANDAVAKVSSGSCLTSPDVEQLRSIWGPASAKH